MKKILLKIYVKLFANKMFYNLNINLFHLSLRGLGISNWQGIVSGEKYFINKILPKLIKTENPVFFDVGVNVGDFTKDLVESFPNSFVYAFEPHPLIYNILSENVKDLKNVKINNLALGETLTTLILYDKKGNDGSQHASLYKEVIDELHKSEVISYNVEVETLDNYVIKNKIENIDFLKIDTEGNEYSVLKGATYLLNQKKIKCIQFEFNEMNIVSRVFFRDFRKILTNYHLFRLLPNSLLKLNDHPIETELFAFQNIIAILKEE